MSSIEFSSVDIIGILATLCSIYNVEHPLSIIKECLYGRRRLGHSYF